MENLPSAHDLFSNAGGYETAFKKGTPIGTIVSGEVTNVEALQVKNYETEELEFWEPGRPKMQMRIVVQTGVLDPLVEGDNGERAIYIKWWGDGRTALMDAVRAGGAKSVEVGGKFAAKLVGTKPTESKNGKALNDAKIFGYQYQAPVQGVDFGQMGEPSEPVQQQAPVQQQWGNPAPQQQAPVQQPPVQQQMPPQAPVQQQAPAQQPPVSQDQAAMQAFQQGLQAQPIQQSAPAQPAPAPAAPPAGDDPVSKARQLIALAFPDDQIAAATGLSPDQVAALR